MMSKVRVTAKVAADRLGISYVVAAGLLSYLEDIGQATVVEKIKHSSGRGKPTNLFEVDENVTLSFAESESVAVAVEESVEEESVEEESVAVAVEESVEEESVAVAVEESVEEETVEETVAEDESEVGEDVVDDEDDEDY